MSKKYFNEFRDEGTHMVGVTRNGTEFMFDKEDFDVVKQFTWHVMKLGYVQTNDCTFGHQMIKLHRMILKLEDTNIKVDHVNHNKLDNRKENLRTCCQGENCMNRRINSDNNSGYKGVYFNKLAKKMGSPNKRKWKTYAYRII